jgi:site-specific DNA-methyltransferase (adenine-specific)
MNKVIHGDCLEILRQMPDAQIDLVYLDPPFFTQKIQSLKSKSRQEYSFDDTWDSMTQYLDFLRVRLVEMRRVMKASASLFFHE